MAISVIWPSLPRPVQRCAGQARHRDISGDVTAATRPKQVGHHAGPARLTLVRLFARCVEGLSTEASPLDYRISRACAALALKSMHRVSCRDDIRLIKDAADNVDFYRENVAFSGNAALVDPKEFAFNLPPRLRRGPLGPKHLLKKILYSYVPRELVDRPKQGFAIPLDSWLRSDLKELANDYLSDARIRQSGIFDAALVRNALQNFYDGNKTLGTPVWFLLAFEMWREQWG